MPLNIIFLGTPEFAVPSLKAVIDQGHNIEMVISQPDRPKGRGLKVERGQVASFADSSGLTVVQPLKLADIKDEILGLDIDGAVVVAFGKLLPDWLLHVGRFGCINVHPSLLPKYRGASPIEWSLLKGDNQTGVSIMKLTEGMDEGPIFIQSKVDIETYDNRQTLSRKLSNVAAEALINTLTLIEQDSAVLVQQNHNAASYTKKISKQDLKISWNEDAQAIINKIRAFSPKPGAYTIINGRRLKILNATVCQVDGGNVGEVVSASSLILRAKNGGVCIEELQPEGKRPMTALDYLRGSGKMEGLIAS